MENLHTPISNLPSIKKAVLFIVLLSLTVNLLSLASPIFMLQIYNTVLPAKSIPNLIAFSVGVLFIYSLHAVFESRRLKLLHIIGASIEWASSRAQIEQEIASYGFRRRCADRDEEKESVKILSEFMSSPIAAALIDIMFLPVYFLVLYVFHPAFCLFLVALIALIFAIEIQAINKKSGTSIESSNSRDFLTYAAGNIAAVRGQGNLETLIRSVVRYGQENIQNRLFAFQKTSKLQSQRIFLRNCMQSGVLAMGAFLIVNDRIEIGAMLAASIIVGRILQSVSAVSSNILRILEVKSAANAFSRWAYVGLCKSDGRIRKDETTGLVVEHLYLCDPKTQRVIIADASLQVLPGECVAIVGAEKSGKTILAEAIVSNIPPARGTIKYNGVEISLSAEARRFTKFGYLPQSITFFSGTVAENISVDYCGDDYRKLVEEHCVDLGLHNLIVSDDFDYSSELRSDMPTLPCSQVLAIALARALFGKPALVVLDCMALGSFAHTTKVFERVIGFCRKSGISVVALVYDAKLAGLFEKSFIIKDGNLRELYTPATLDVVHSYKQTA